MEGLSPDVPIQECLVDISKQVRQAEGVVSEIDVLLREFGVRVEAASNGASNAIPNTKPSKILWIRRKPILSRLTIRVSSIVTNLVATLHILQAHKPSHIPAHPQDVVIQDINIVREQPPMSETTESILPIEQQIERTIMELRGTGAMGTVSSSTPSNMNSLSRRSSTESFHSFASSITHIPSSSFVALRGTLSPERCRPFCRCQCHLNTHVNMPSWAKGFLGSIHFHGNSSVLLNRRPCNLQSCRGKPATVQFSY